MTRELVEQCGHELPIFDGVVEAQWRAAEHMFEQARVDNLAVADFRPGTELYRSLVLAVECVGKRVALRRLARGD